MNTSHDDDFDDAGDNDDADDDEANDADDDDEDEDANDVDDDDDDGQGVKAEGSFRLIMFAVAAASSIIVCSAWDNIFCPLSHFLSLFLLSLIHI